MRELYDHRNDARLYDVNSFENENVADDPAIALHLRTSQLHCATRGATGKLMCGNCVQCMTFEVLPYPKLDCWVVAHVG